MSGEDADCKDADVGGEHERAGPGKPCLAKSCHLSRWTVDALGLEQKDNADDGERAHDQGHDFMSRKEFEEQSDA